MMMLRIRRILLSMTMILTVAFAESALASDFQGKYIQGNGDAATLQRIDQSFQFFHANPDVPNVTMIYRSDWNAFEEGAGWGAWWIQNSYGCAYASSPFLLPCYRTAMQNSLDLHWNNQGDGVHKGKGLSPGHLVYDLIAPDGALGDCATPTTIIYKQGDGNVAIHDWFYEGTAAGVIMQAEMLLTTRDRDALAKYLPKMDRACNHIETARDPSNNLFLVGPSSNLLAPSYGGIKQADGTFGKGYLTGLSVTYLGAAERMVELYKLAGDTAKQAEYQHRVDITRKSLDLLKTKGDQGDYFVKSIEKTDDGLGKKHGVVGQKEFGYLDGVTNVDALALRTTDPATSLSVYNTIAANPIRPFDFLMNNAEGLDDTYANYGGTELKHFLRYGQWVNGGCWSTVEGRAILAYAQVGKFDDIARSADRAMNWAKDFRMDAPFSQFGENTNNPWSDTGPHHTGGTSVMIDNFAIPAATIRGLFDYDYRADRLILRPRVPGEITKYEQKEPIYFGDKRIYLTCLNGGPNVTSVTVNGVATKVSSPTEAVLFYNSLPAQAHVQITTDGGWPESTLPAKEPGTYTVTAPVPLSASLRTPYGELKTMSRTLADREDVEYEKSFVNEALAAINAWQISCSTDRGPGIYRPMTPEKVNAINTVYHNAAITMYRGFANAAKQSSLGSLWNSIVARTATAEMQKVNATDDSSHFAPSSDDLANQGTATLSGISGSETKILNDGKMNDAYVPSEGDQLIIKLDTSANKNGYDISKIISYSASDRDCITQNYDIDVKQIGSTEWTPVFSGYDLGRDVQEAFDKDNSGRELKVTVQDSTDNVLCTRVSRVRFTFHDTNGFHATGGAKTAYREIDLIGKASVSRFLPPGQ